MERFAARTSVSWAGLLHLAALGSLVLTSMGPSLMAFGPLTTAALGCALICVMSLAVDYRAAEGAAESSAKSASPLLAASTDALAAGEEAPQTGALLRIRRAVHAYTPHAVLAVVSCAWAGQAYLRVLPAPAMAWAGARSAEGAGLAVAYLLAAWLPRRVRVFVHACVGVGAVGSAVGGALVASGGIPAGAVVPGMLSALGMLIAGVYGTGRLCPTEPSRMAAAGAQATGVLLGCAGDWVSGGRLGRTLTAAACGDFSLLGSAPATALLGAWALLSCLLAALRAGPVFEAAPHRTRAVLAGALVGAGVLCRVDGLSDALSASQWLAGVVAVPFGVLLHSAIRSDGSMRIARGALWACSLIVVCVLLACAPEMGIRPGHKVPQVRTGGLVTPPLQSLTPPPATQHGLSTTHAVGEEHPAAPGSESTLLRRYTRTGLSLGNDHIVEIMKRDQGARQLFAAVRPMLDDSGALRTDITAIKADVQDRLLNIMLEASFSGSESYDALLLLQHLIESAARNKEDAAAPSRPRRHREHTGARVGPGRAIPTSLMLRLVRQRVKAYLAMNGLTFRNLTDKILKESIQYVHAQLDCHVRHDPYLKEPCGEGSVPKRSY